MKATLFFRSVSTLIVSLFVLVSCEKSHSPLMLAYPDESVVFDNEARNIALGVFGPGVDLQIKGGDGKYAVKVSDTAKVEAACRQNALRIAPRAEGRAVVSISDGAGQTYDLAVGIGRFEETYVLIDFYDIVTGKEITLKQREELRARIAADAYVGVKGGYRLVYDNVENTRGTAFMYQKSLNDSKYKECGFELNKDRESFKDQRPVINGEPLPAFALLSLSDQEGTSRLFLTPDLGPAPKASEVVRTFSFVEEVTHRYQADFPTAGDIFTVQRVVRDFRLVY